MATISSYDNQQDGWVSRADSDGNDPLSVGLDAEEMVKIRARIINLEGGVDTYLQCKNCGVAVEEDSEPLLSRTPHELDTNTSSGALCMDCMIKGNDTRAQEIAGEFTQPRRLLPPRISTRLMMESISPLTLPPSLFSTCYGSKFDESSISSLLSTPVDGKGGPCLAKPCLRVVIPSREEQIASEHQAEREWAHEMRQRHIQIATTAQMRNNHDGETLQTTWTQTTVVQGSLVHDQLDPTAQDEYAFDQIQSPKRVSMNEAENEEEDEGFEESEYQYTEYTESLSSILNRFSHWIQTLAASISHEEMDAGQ